MISVLLVDEEPLILDITREYLGQSGDMTVTCSESVPEALEKLASGRFDVIVSDYDMPGTTGIEFLKLLKAKGDDTPFIIFTGKGREQVAMEALNSGADFYLQKGGSPKAQFAELRNMIGKAVQKRWAEQSLRESERRFRDTLENIRLIAIQLDPSGTITFCNRYLLDLCGWKREEVMGRNWFDLFICEDDRETVRSILDAVLAREESDIHNENRIVTRSGECREIFWNHTVLRELNGTPIGISSIGEDVTEQKRAEQALFESERKFRTLYDNANDAIFIADAGSGMLVDANQKAEELIGRSLDEIRCMHHTELHPPEEQEEYTRNFQKHVTVQSGITEEVVVHRSGRRIPVLVSAKVFDLEGQRFIQGIFHDISERKTAEAVQAMLAAIVQSSDDAIIGEDLEGRITSWNEGAERLYGYRAEEIVGRNVYELLPAGEKKARDVIIGKIREGERLDHFETVRLRKDGDTVLVSLSTSPIRDPEGRIIGIANIARDLTRQRETERAFLAYVTEAALRLKNPIELIGSRLEDIEAQIERGDMSDEEIRLQIQTQIQNIGQVVKNLNELNRVILQSIRNIPDAYQQYLTE